MKRRLTSTLNGFALVWLLTAPAYARATAPISETELVPNDPFFLRHFGSAVAIDGETVVVGAPLDPAAGFDAGSAYVFVRAGSTWSQQAKLFAADASSSSQFGFSVAVSGDTIVVGAPHAVTRDMNTGAAYVFVRSGSTWTQQARLAPADATGADLFGNAVAVEGDTLAVGAIGAAQGFPDEGAVYVYGRSGATWTPQARVRSDQPGTGNEFGFSIALNRGTLAIGSPYDDDLGIADAGAVYVFTGSGATWNLQTELTANDAAANDHLGWSVALHGDTLVSGAPQHNPAAADSAGAAYVFVRNGASWSQQTELAADDAAVSDSFGYAVAVNNRTAVIGSAFDSSFAQNGGSAYVFTQAGNVWRQDIEFSAANVAPDFQFGFSIAVSGTNLVVGAPIGGFGQDGAAYVYEFPASNTGPVADPQSVTTPEDTPVTVTLTGSDSEGDPLTFTVLSNPTKGVLTGTPPNLMYTPDANLNGTDSFTFQVNDGALDSVPATVSLAITPVNDPPLADNLSVTTPEDTAVIITLTGSDLENSPLTFTVVSGPAAGTLSGTPPNLIYTPDAQATGPDSFTFQANDGELDSAPATVSINITPLNHAPVADASATPTEVISANNLDAIVTLDGSRSYDADNDPLTYTWLEGGSVIGAGATGQVTLAVGVHAITLMVSDGAANDSAAVTVRVVTLAQAIMEIIDTIQTADLATAPKNALIASLRAAANACARGNRIAAVNQLQAFENKVNAQAGKKIDETTANDLIAAAQNIIRTLTGVPATSQPLRR